MTEFLAPVVRDSSVGGVCHDLEMMVLHDMLSPAPDVATGAFLSPWLSQKQALSPARTLPCQSAVPGVDCF